MNHLTSNQSSQSKKILANYVVSLGSCCHTATFLKTEKLKLCSFPFDWIFCGPKINYEILTDNFKTFLDSSLYTKLAEHRSGHKVYGHRFFNHKDPKTIADYEYYKRCIARLYEVINQVEHKVFIITNVMDRGARQVIKEEEIEYTYKLCNYLKSICSNFSLLYIDPIKLSVDEYNAKTIKYEIKQEGNLYWIKLYVQSDSDGIKFLNANDNVTYKESIYSLFDFDIKK